VETGSSQTASTTRGSTANAFIRGQFKSYN
jgi:hypothetical protein